MYYLALSRKSLSNPWHGVMSLSTWSALAHHQSTHIPGCGKRETDQAEGKRFHLQKSNVNLHTSLLIYPTAVNVVGQKCPTKYVWVGLSLKGKG